LKKDMGSRILVVGTATRDVDRLLIRPNDSETRRPRVDFENGARAQGGGERLIARDIGLCEPGKTAGKQSRACDGTDKSHGGVYGEGGAKVPEAVFPQENC
jgi:hypothetical protein